MTARKTRTKRKHLVTKSLENISKKVFTMHYNQLTELIGSSHGVYALYDGGELYYVGKSSDLKKRVKQHLSDKHLGNWNRFSLYLVKDEKNVGEIESLIIRIADPKGNSKKPHWKPGEGLKKELAKMLEEKHKEEMADLLGKPGKNKSAAKMGKAKHTLEGLVTRKTLLYRTYKGKDYVAYLSPRGIIRYKKKNYHSPTGAAMAIVTKGGVNGWRFWYVKDESGTLVKLEELRG